MYQKHMALEKVLKSRFVLWAFNEYAKYMLDKGAKPLVIIDKNKSLNEYNGIKITDDKQILDNANVEYCIVCSPSHYGDIEEEIINMGIDIEVLYVGQLMKNAPFIQVIRNIQDIERSNYLHGCVHGEIIINGAITLQLEHRLPVVINVDRKARVEFDTNTIMDAVEISARAKSIVQLGTNTYMNKYSIVRAKEKISIGKNCAIAWNVVIMDNDGHQIISEGNVGSKPVIIKDNVWIGNNVNVLKGSLIGNGCVVAAGSVLNSEFGEKELIAGAPGKRKKGNVKWK